MLLIPQLEPFPPRPSSTLCMGKCQFSYKAFDMYSFVFKIICLSPSYVASKWESLISEANLQGG